MTTKYTSDHRIKLEAYLATHTLPNGLGYRESACTLAAINLAMRGKLTDDIPACMSNVLGKATIQLQDAMPAEMRNSDRYKALIPNMPGTGRAHEAERLAVLMDWMWTVVLPQIQPIADQYGFSESWQKMCKEKTVDAARAAARAARAASYAARAAADAAAVAARAAYAADAAADAAAAARAARAVAVADAVAAADASAADASAARNAFWVSVDPISVLERMTYLAAAS
jgi:hypothetical protein